MLYFLKREKKKGEKDKFCCHFFGGVVFAAGQKSGFLKGLRSNNDETMNGTTDTG